MVVMPKLKDYDIKVLASLGDQTDDFINRNKIKLLIIEKILLKNYTMFFLVNNFMTSKKNLKEAYAEVIVIKMKDCEYVLDDNTLNEILSLTSLDTLILYGADSKSYEFRHKCVLEFWNRGTLIEDKAELNRKGKVKTLQFRKKRKVIENDKY